LQDAKERGRAGMH